QAAQLEVGERLVGDGRAHVRRGGQLRVEGVGPGQADKPLVVLLRPLDGALESTAETRPSSQQPQDDDLSAGRRGVDKCPGIVLCLEVPDVVGAYGGKVRAKA